MKKILSILVLIVLLFTLSSCTVKKTKTTKEEKYDNYLSKVEYGSDVSIKLIAEVLNQISSDEDEEIRTEKLKEMVGHTPLQVFFGVVIGILMTVVYCLVANVGYCAMA